MKVTLYCTCGATATGTIRPDDGADKFKALWQSGHSGEGHAPCDAKTAAKARRKQEWEHEKLEAR